MTFNYENLEFNFSYANLEDFIGEGRLTISREDMINLIDLTSEYEEEMDYYDICSFIGYNDDIVQWLEYYGEDDFSTVNIDLQIVLFYYFLDLGEPTKFTYEGENPFWILHDLCHAEKDTDGITVYVDKYIEEERIFEGMYLAKELNMLHHVNVDLLKQIKSSFKERWDYEFDINRAVELLNGRE